jgi:hypothetical protein
MAGVFFLVPVLMNWGEDDGHFRMYFCLPDDEIFARLTALVRRPLPALSPMFWYTTQRDSFTRSPNLDLTTNGYEGDRVIKF